MYRLLLSALLLASTSIAEALDASDVGTYAVIHRDGHVTDFTFFVSQAKNQWNIEERKPDGSWANITCERDCILHDSTAGDIKRFFPKSALAQIAPSCVHNTAFAFCNYKESARSGAASYVFIALTESQPIPLRLKKLSGDRIAHAESGGWVTRGGTPAQNSDSMKSINGFGGWLVITPDMDWKEKWDTSPETTPHFSEAKNVSYGQQLVILPFFINPKVNASGEIDVLCDIKVTRPDGSLSSDAKGIQCARGKLQGSPRNIRLTTAVIKYIGEEGDPAGEWTVEVTLTDKVRGTAVPLKTRFSLSRSKAGDQVNADVEVL